MEKKITDYINIKNIKNKTEVVNVSVKNLRPKYKNLKEWFEDNDNVYIGRKGIVFIDNKRFPEFNSIWHNPFKITETEDRDAVVSKYETYIREKIINDNLHEKLLNLKNKKLGCWCHPNKCHGDVLTKLINEFDK